MFCNVTTLISMLLLRLTMVMMLSVWLLPVLALKMMLIIDCDWVRGVVVKASNENLARCEFKSGSRCSPIV